MPVDQAFLLVDAVRRLSMARTIAEVQAVVRHSARALCGADGATVVLRDGDHCHYADEDAIAPLWKGQRFPLTDCASGWVMRHGQAVAIEDIYADDRVLHDAYRPTFVQSLALVPIRPADAIGAIGNYWSTQHRATPHELRLLSALADATAVALENVRLWGAAEEEVADRTADLDAALELSRDLTGTLAHELRNAVGGGAGLLRAVLDDPSVELADDVRGDLTVALDGVDAGLVIVEQQLALAKNRARELEPRASQVDLDALLSGLERTYGALRRGGPVALVVDPPPGGLALKTDLHLLTQILRNLISNALKFTDAGEVRLRVASRDGGATVTFCVSDTGIGIASADQVRIFAAFEQVDGEQDGRPAGTGLGLPFVQRVTQLLGGQLDLESNPGAGTTLCVTLPADPTPR